MQPLRRLQHDLELALCGRAAARSERCLARPGAFPLSSWNGKQQAGECRVCAGELPPSWGRSGAFGNLKALVLRENDLQGGLPASWAQPAAFASLNHLDVAGARPAGGARALLSRDLASCGTLLPSLGL